MARPRPHLSVLDLAIVGEGSSHTEALAASVDLAKTVERLGYRRHWVAEHHNMPGIASSAPAVLAATLAAETENMRIGSGGVMLPNHAPLVVAEQFGMLEALHPGRIDLGIGRAPGTDGITAAALRRSLEPLSDDEFPRQLAELLAFFRGEFPDGHPYNGITAVPGKGDMPEIWLLGSSGYSAQVAGMLGMRFAFAHHFMPQNTDAALELYRSHFQPSAELPEPYAIVAVAAIAAEDDERARYLSGPARLSMARLRAGMPTRFPTPEEAAAHEFTAAEEASVKPLSGSAMIGSAATVCEKLEAFAERTAADELMITTMVHGHEDRIRSYELIAGAWAAARPAASGVREAQP
ncbi:MAG TPA: LLM class flavin-dependent oxidoreductase [Solirubrobacterales bacterium]|nr:LLM class flavin-dependent oxidoreductase [Solirubrobacterales bacterium]